MDKMVKKNIIAFSDISSLLYVLYSSEIDLSGHDGLSFDGQDADMYRRINILDNNAGGGFDGG